MSYFQKRKNAFRYAFKGIAELIKKEAHAKLHILAAVLVTVAGFWFRIECWEWVSIVICIGAVFMAEAFNSAIERLADKISREKDPLIGQAKDLGAAAVLLFAIASLIVAAIIFLPRF